MKRDEQGLLDYLANGKQAHDTWDVLAEHFGFATGNAARKFAKRNRKTNEPVMLTYEQHTGIETALRDASLNPKEWEVKELWSKRKEILDPVTKGNKFPLFETTAKISPRQKEVENFKQQFIDFANSYAKINNKPIIKKADNHSPNILIISLTDLHLDKKSYFEEVREHGDLDLAKSRALNACVDLIDRAAASHDLSKIVILSGHDLFHANSSGNTTQKGTPLDVDGRWHQTFREGLTLATNIIDYAKQFSPVEYINVIGNHGPERDQYLAIALEAFYRNDENITIESTYTYRKYFSFGRSAFMLTHDTGRKTKDLPVLFATEKPEMFASCKYRYILSGHYHKSHEMQFVSTNENYGIVFKVLPSLSSTDEWHFKNGFVGNQKSCIGLIVNHDYGLVAELLYNE